MQAGKLDRRIRIERNSPTKDDLGGEIERWVEVATVWASKAQVSDGERFRAGENAAFLNMRFLTRWSQCLSAVDERHRLIFEGRPYNITAVKEIGRRLGLEITAGARAETPR